MPICALAGGPGRPERVRPASWQFHAHTVDDLRPHLSNRPGVNLRSEDRIRVAEPVNPNPGESRIPGEVARPRIPLMLIAALAAIVALSGVGLSAAGWVIGVTCGVITNGALARGLSRYQCDRLGPADWVTLARATLAIGVAAMVADSFHQPVPVAMLVSVTVIALALDAVDGWVARRTRTTGVLGAQFDAEVDAFLILILSVYVARTAGAWVLAIGAARYAFLAAGWALPWMREPLPPRYWRKVVAAMQGIVLTIGAAHVLPPAVTQAALVAALVLLAESFGRDVWWLWRHRHPTHSRGAGGAPAPRLPVAPPAGARRARLRTGIAAALTTLALLLVWVALV